MTSSFFDTLIGGKDTHANRPATAKKGALYSCSTHSLVYRYDGAAWQTWAVLVGAAAVPAGGTTGQVLKKNSATDYDDAWGGQQEVLMVALGDETTAITTGTAKVTFRMPFAMTLSSVRASLTTASSSGLPTVDIKESGTTIFSTKLTIDATEKTSTTAATAAVISDPNLADDAEITFNIDVAGTGAAGLKVYLIGTRA